METPSKQTKFGLEGKWGKGRGRLHTVALWSAGALLLCSLAGGSVVAGETNNCQQSAAGALASAKAGAKSAYRLALGKCANISNPGDRSSCEKQAGRDYRDALTLADEQNTLRLGVCETLGGATYEPIIDPANFSTVIDNPYFPLIPGTTFVYEGQTSDGLEHVEFAVTHTTKVVQGVTCVEIHDSRFLDGILTEDTRDWFAQDKEGAVWYFGENTTLVDNGLPVNLHGTWTGGVDGAQPGFLILAHPVVGALYRQEFSLGNAEDQAEVVSLNAKAVVPYGSFNHCLKTLESSPLAPGDLENKFYAPGVGNLLTIDLATGERSELVQIITE